MTRRYLHTEFVDIEMTRVTLIELDEDTGSETEIAAEEISCGHCILVVNDWIDRGMVTEEEVYGTSDGEA